MNAIIPARRSVVDQIFGDNKAPLTEVLTADFTELQGEIADLLNNAADLPARVESDADQAKVGNWIIDAKDLTHKIEVQRTTEGKPILDAQRGINAFFKAVAQPISETMDAHQREADDYVRRKAAEERARREREAEELRRKEEEERRRLETLKRPDAIARAEGKAEALASEAEAAEERALASNADLTRMRAEGVTGSARTAWTWEFTDKDAAYNSLGPLGPFFTESAVSTAINSMVRAHKGRTRLPGIRVFEQASASFRR
ncbi:hypothetical protein [Paracoccus sp. KR1-242]|uniref:hypothetical protein n=1 Tax=Paracoccus sp. KR1-242 TaxID=3410028 RepID=UPI003BFEC917